MGEMADYMINGDDCQECGEYLGEGDGYPRSCASCRAQHKHESRIPKGQMIQRVACPSCGKKIKAVGLKDHQRDAHGSTAIKGVSK